VRGCLKLTNPKYKFRFVQWSEETFKIRSVHTRSNIRISRACQGDTNQNPTGGTRKLVYGLYPGEAMWQLKVEKSETLTGPLKGGISDDKPFM
jgi:hypothetical protein